LKLAVLPALGYAVIRCLGWTLRLQRLHAERVEALWAEGQNVIVAFWHGRQLMMPLAARRPKAAVLISEHRDGELIARILSWFHLAAIRGSSSRGGSRALRQLVKAGEEGDDLVVTPDGPRGPRCVAHAGIIELAKLTGLPIVPVTFGASKKNSSGAGIGLRSRCHLHGPASSGESRSGLIAARMTKNTRTSGWN
jgi:hypothetical protein